MAVEKLYLSAPFLVCKKTWHQFSMLGKDHALVLNIPKWKRYSKINRQLLISRLLPTSWERRGLFSSIFGNCHMVSLYKQATFPTLQLVTGWWTSNPIKTHQLAFSNMAFFQRPSWSVSTVSWFRQSLLSPSLLIFPLCARPGHLYQSARPTSKEKSIHRWRLGHSCYSCHAWWFSRAGCRIFQKQLCASGADSTPAQKGFYLYSFPPLREKRKKKTQPAPPLPSVGIFGLLPGLTQTQNSTRNIRSPSLCLPLLNTTQPLYREASSTSSDVGSFFTSCTFRTKKKMRVGRCCPFGYMIISWQSSTHQCAIAQPLMVYFISWCLDTSVLLLDITKQIGTRDFRVPISHFPKSRQIWNQPWAIKVLLLSSVPLPSHTTHTCCDMPCPSYQIPCWRSK